MTKIIYTTIAAANYLPQILLLRDSIRRAHGDADFRVLLAEHPATVARLRPQLPDLTLLGLDEIDCPEWVHMAFYYNVMELSTAVKPALLRSLLRQGHVVFFDPDIEVFSSMAPLEEELRQADILLTPHVTRPLPEDGRRPSMHCVLRKGQFNLGFIGVHQAPQNVDLMSWWHQQLVEQAIDSEEEGLFTDQFWAAAFASFARRLHVLRSAQYNMAYWNIVQRQLSWDGQGVPQTEDGPLVFFHYSGLQRDAVERVSKHQDRITARPGTPLHGLLQSYVDRLDSSPHRHFTGHPYSFATYSDGVPIRPEHRRAFLRVAAQNRRQVPNPFAARGYVEAIISQSPVARFPDFAAAAARVVELERRLSTLPHSLFDHAGTAMDLVMPGSRDRLYRVLRSVSERYGGMMAHKTASIKQLLQ